MNTNTNVSPVYEVENDPFIIHLRQQQEERTERLRNQDPYENRQMFLDEVKEEMTIDNTIYPLMDTRDDTNCLLDLDEVRYIVLPVPKKSDLSPRGHTISWLLGIFAMKEYLKTGETREKVCLSHHLADELFKYFEIAEMKGNGEINPDMFAQRVTKIYSEVREHIYANNSFGDEELQELETLKEFIKKNRGDQIFEEGDWSYLEHYFRERSEMDEY